MAAHDSNRIVVNSEVDGYGEYSQNINNIDTSVTLFLQPVNATVEFSSNVEAKLTVAGEEIVTIPANAIIDENGNSPSGTLLADITIIEPSIDPSLMPGNYETLNTESGATSKIESFGAISVQFRDDTNHQYNLAEGQTAVINIPATGDTPPNSIPLYYFDRDSGYWIEEGSATLTTSSTGNLYYQGNVSHFTTWNADMVYDSIQFQSCVVDPDGVRIPNAQVVAQGTDYIGLSSANTDDDGFFSILAKMNSTVLLSIKTITGASRTYTIETSDTDYIQDECFQVVDAAAVVTLTWGQDPRDLDTHFFGPNSASGEEAFEIYYSNKEFSINESSIWLDVDDITSFGPEITTISSFPFSGRYSYAVYKYAGSSDIAASPARVKVEYNGETQIFSPPSGEATDCWSVFDFVVLDNGTVSIEPTANWASTDYCHAQEYSNSSDETITQRQQRSKLKPKKESIMQKMINSKYYNKQ